MRTVIEIAMVVLCAAVLAAFFFAGRWTKQCPEPSCMLYTVQTEEGCVRIVDTDLRPWEDVLRDIGVECSKCK